MNFTKTAAATAVALGAIFSTTVLAQGYGGYVVQGSGYPQVGYAQGGYGGQGGHGSQGYAGQGRGLERRDASNIQRIEHGIRTGQLTPREAQRLQWRQAEIDRMQAIARNDGFMAPHERERIAAAQEDLSQAIWRLKHNERQARY